MLVNINLNGKTIKEDINPGVSLYSWVREHKCYSVKCGCETSNCGLCTVFLNDTPVLSCSVLAARADGCHVTTLEGLQDEASEFVTFIADQGAEQCGFCNPGFVMNTIALLRQNPYPDEDEVKEFLSGNLCRCSGYEGQLRGIMNFVNYKSRRRVITMKSVNKCIRKKDSMELLLGKPVYTDDLTPKDCLVVKLLRSPYANAIIKDINTAIAMKVPGIEAIYTYKDIDQHQKRFTCAGQTYPEPSPYDRLILDQHVRFIGDPVAIVAGETENCVDKAIKLIKAEYEVLEPVLDFTTALDNPILVHPEDNWEALCPVGADNKRNLCAHDESSNGDVDKVLDDCDIIIDRTYHTKACQQSMMETFRTYCTIDTYGRLNVISSTQIVFHCRRIISHALGISPSLIRVTKPRIGGGFGAKQTSVSEIYPAFVTWMTKKPSKIIFSRYESLTASSPRHEMQMHVRLGATKMA